MISLSEKQKGLSKRSFFSGKRYFLSIGVFSCIINLLMLTGPLFMLQVYDRVLASRSVPTLFALTLLVIGLYAFMGVLELIRSRMMGRIGRLVDEELGASLFERVMFHALRRTPNINAQPLRDLESLRQFLSGPGPLALFDLPWMPLYLAIVFLMHFWLGVLALSGALILFALAVLNEVRTRNPIAEATRSSLAAHSFAEESRRNTEVIHAMGMLPSLQKRWQNLRVRALSDHDLASDRGGAISTVTKVLRMFLQSAVLALGAYLAIYQELSPGAMIAASIIMSRALAPVEQSIAQWRSFLNVRQAYQRLKLVFAKTPDAETPMLLPEPKGHISVENLILMPPEQERILLQGVNFSLEPGQALGIIGPTGAGKSTLARALVGVWPIAKGSVRLDGAPFDQWPQEQIGKTIGYLPQDVELFAGTVEENIARFQQEPEDAQAVLKASQLANVHDLVLRLPEGYKTRIGEGGDCLSAGQRQRIGLARALYGDPRFIVLDEPNSNLDMEGEMALVEAIQSLKAQGVTVVVIAHRPSAIKAVDLVLFLKEGQQQAFGPRDEVLARITKAATDTARPDITRSDITRPDAAKSA